MKILKQLDLNDVVFIDIETVKIVEKLEKGTPLFDSWEYKMKYSRDAEQDAAKALEQSFDDKAALYAEFAKIVCITIGKIKNDVLMLKTFADHDEAKLLKEFCNTITNITAANKKTLLCGHAIKGFDIPFVMRRCIVNQVDIPTLFDVAHLKPWELTAIDTLELWKGSAFTSASLLNITIALGLPSPKDDVIGYETSNIYYADKDKGLQRIATYCEKDVLTVANIIRKCRYETIVESEISDMKVKKVGFLEAVYNSGKVDKAAEDDFIKKYNALNDDEKIIADEILKIAKTKNLK